MAWYHTQLTSGGGLYPGYMQVAVRPARAHRFRRAQLLKYDQVGLSGLLTGMSPTPILLAPADYRATLFEIDRQGDMLLGNGSSVQLGVSPYTTLTPIAAGLAGPVAFALTP